MLFISLYEYELLVGFFYFSWKIILSVSCREGQLVTTLTFFKSAAAAAKSLQSCPTLCDPIDSSPPGTPIPGILQARTLEWVAVAFSNAWKWKVKVKSLSHVWLLVTPWTAAYQAPPPMGFSRQEDWSGVPLPSPTHSIGDIYIHECRISCFPPWIMKAGLGFAHC